MRKTLILTVLFTLLFAASAFGRDVMRYDGRKVERWDSVADVISQFGEPDFKIDLGEVDTGNKRCRVELWVYEKFPWRYELRIRSGRVWSLQKIRLKRVR